MSIAHEIRRVATSLEVFTMQTQTELKLAEVQDLKAYVGWLEIATVQALRAEGKTWDEIGRAIGISRQSAHERFNQYGADEGEC